MVLWVVLKCYDNLCRKIIFSNKLVRLYGFEAAITMFTFDINHVTISPFVIGKIWVRHGKKVVIFNCVVAMKSPIFVVSITPPERRKNHSNRNEDKFVMWNLKFVKSIQSGDFKSKKT